MSKFQSIDLVVPPDKNVYFASDFHLGSLKGERGRQQETDIVSWLRSVEADAGCLFLVGDVFDYWFEYKYVVHKGAVRLLGQLARMTDAGIPLYYFTGNHDMWVRDYFEKELNAVVSRKPVSFSIAKGGNTARFLVGHGDGLGPGDHTYKQLKKLFESPFARGLFRQVHPDLATRLAFAWSKRSRAANDRKGEEAFKGEDKEWLFQYCLGIESADHYDYYVFGHRHLPLDLQVAPGSRYINLGEWFSAGSRYPYGKFDGNTMALKFYR